MTYLKFHMMLIKIFICFTAFAFSDSRIYVWTYEYQTMEKGAAEVEHYLTFKGNDRYTTENAVTTIHNIELEIGMNDRFDVGLYQNFSQAPEGNLRYDGYKVRMRYRLSEKGTFILDPLLYMEYKGTPDFSTHVLEGKLILAKDMGNLNIALNPVIETALSSRENVTEFKYNAGISYRVNPLLALGLEIKGAGDQLFMGPVVSHGVDGLWVAIGSAFALNNISNGHNPFQIRLITGIHF